MHLSSNRQFRTAGKMVATEPLWLRALLVLLAIGVVTWLILIPLVYVFWQAFGSGLGVYWKNMWQDPDTRHAVWLTLTVAPLSVVLNTIFGLAAAWAITKFEFRGKSFLVTLLDLPFAVSPVVAGLCFMLVFGMQGWLGPSLREMGIKVVFSWPGILLATMFVTLPFVARELIPLMQALGSDEELAAISLGANPWQLFWRITLPNIRWGLLFGVIQCHARAIGEFGAVFIVSGHIEGETDTMPLRVEKLFQQFNNPGSFAVASSLALMALATLIGKVVLEKYSATETIEQEEKI